MSKADGEGQAILQPDSTAPPNNINITDLGSIIDTHEIQLIMDDFYKLTDISAWILDLKGNVLIATGWQDICRQFHRVNSETCRNCEESDLVLSTGVAEGTFKLYKCKNNMWDMVTPITLGGQHTGNLFLGQFLYDDEALDYDLFRSQARKYGFNEEAYISALERIPKWSREHIEDGMAFYSKFAQLLSLMSYKNVQLKRAIAGQKLADEQRRLSDLALRSSINAIAIADFDGRLTYVNPAFLKMFGFGDEIELMGREISVFWKQEGEQNVIQALMSAGNWFGEMAAVNKAGLNFSIQVSANMVTNAMGKSICTMFSLVDISEKKKGEAELLQYRQHLEEMVKAKTEELGARNLELEELNIVLGEANRHKSQFLANMSHELRTPLNSIIGFTKIILDGLEGPISQMQENDLKIVYKNSRHLLVLINDLLDLAKIEAGRVSLAIEEVAVNDLIDEVVPVFNKIALEKKLSLTHDVSQSAVSMKMDRMKIKQVLMNLLSNSYKFTNRGSIRLTVDRSEGEYIFAVSDTGIGIKKADMLVIFDSFRQVAMAHLAGYEGTGLGLSISKEYVEMHGGRIWVESEFGTGSTFFFTLPEIRQVDK